MMNITTAAGRSGRSASSCRLAPVNVKKAIYTGSEESCKMRLSTSRDVVKFATTKPATSDTISGTSKVEP
eukprot:scaffold10417_cov33-Tisochrysis_lutea.AAC.3